MSPCTSGSASASRLRARSPGLSLGKSEARPPPTTNRRFPAEDCAASTFLPAQSSLHRVLQRRLYPLQQPLLCRPIRQGQLPVAEDATVLQPRQELRRRPQAEHLAHRRRVVEARRLVV